MLPHLTRPYLLDLWNEEKLQESVAAFRHGGAATATWNEDIFNLSLAALGWDLDGIICIVRRRGERTLNTRDPKGFTLLMQCAAYGDVASVRWLLQGPFAYSGRRDNKGATILLHAAGCMHVGYSDPAAASLELVRMLITRGWSYIDERDAYGCSALLYAAGQGHLATVRWLLREGADMRERDNIGRGALLHACSSGSLETVRWLLASGGASITEADANGRKAVHYACAYKRRGEIDNVEHSVREQGLLQYLLSAEAMLLADRDSSGHTPLMIAARIGNLGLLRWLHTSWGADVVSQEDDEGMSVMHHAVISGSLPLLRWLLEVGCNVDAYTKPGVDCLCIAAHLGFLQVVKWILNEGGSRITEHSLVKESALGAGARHLPVVQYLLSHGATIQSQDDIGRDVIFFAALWVDEGGHNTLEWLLGPGGAAITPEHMVWDRAEYPWYDPVPQSAHEEEKSIALLHILLVHCRPPRRVIEHATDRQLALITSATALRRRLPKWGRDRRATTRTALVTHLPQVIADIVVGYARSSIGEVWQWHEKRVADAAVAAGPKMALRRSLRRPRENCDGSDDNGGGGSGGGDGGDDARSQGRDVRQREA